MELVYERDTAQEEELGAAPTVHLDFVPEEGVEEPSDQELWQQAERDVQ